MMNGSEPPQGANIPGVPPEPVPMLVTVTHTKLPMMNTETNQVEQVDYVQLFVATNQGMQVYFLDLKMAEQVAMNTLSHIQQAKSDLIIPNSADVTDIAAQAMKRFKEMRNPDAEG